MGRYQKIATDQSQNIQPQSSLNLRLIFLLAIHALILIGAFFTAFIPFDAHLAVVSTIFSILLFLPSKFALIKALSARQVSLGLACLAVAAVGIEWFAVKTGFPYGQFWYDHKAGIMLFNAVPLTTPFAWATLVLGCTALAACRSKVWWKIWLLATLNMVWVDLLLDPMAVSLHLWHWASGGWYYGVPYTNFIGWLFSGLIGAALAHTLLIKKIINAPHVLPKLKVGLYFSLLFWLCVVFFKDLLVPFMTGVAFLLFYRHSFSAAIGKFLYD